jgi:hypothetical protein
MMLLWSFLIGAAVDSIPIFAPPAWTLLIILIIKYRANPWGVLVFGVAGSCLGRYNLTRYIRKLSMEILNLAEEQNLEFASKIFDQGFWRTNLFVFLYTLTPLSTTTLFTAAAMGQDSVLSILPAFALGKLISDGVMIFTAKGAAGGIRDLIHGRASAKTVAGAVFTVLMISAFLFVDWREFIEKRRLKLRFRIWKSANPSLLSQK